MQQPRGVLPWLAPAPSEVRSTIRSLGTEPSLEIGKLRRIAATELDITQLGRLSKVVNDRRKEIAADGNFASLRLGLVGSHTLDFIADALCATAVRHGLLLSLVRTPYGQVAQVVLDPGSELAQSKVDVVLLALDAIAIGIHRPQLSEEAASTAVRSAIEQMKTLRDGIRSMGATVAFQTIPLPPAPLFGSFDAQMPGSPRAMAEKFNSCLRDIALSGDVIIDIAYAAASIGLTRWHDPRAWHSAKLPFALEVTPLYADHVCRVLAALRGKSRKCIVLDLDNTLWGGVIGDDGLEGIVLGNGSGAGEAFVAIQQLALDLRSRGVILAICSKNDRANAILPFREHAEMLLKEHHIACFVANWKDKAANIRDIAKMLNIGADALVFLDDNPAERAIIRQELPEVAVPEVGDDPADYPNLVACAGYFESLTFSEEDRQRADYYRENAERLQSQGSITNIAEYLASLDMTMDARPFDAIGRARITQLINKSNQFNLTSRRYTEAEVKAAEQDPNKFTLQVRLVDKFGDNGMISVIIFDKDGQEWSCDTWLMSCRVLGRRVEEAALSVVAQAALAEGAKALIGRYIPTKKNSLVIDHFAKLGFTRIDTKADGPTEWRLNLAGYQPTKLPMSVNTAQFESA